MNYRAVLFDMDGVIVDSEPLHAKAYQQTLKRYGHVITDEQYKAHIYGRTDADGLRSYFDAQGVADGHSAVLAEKAKTYLALAADALVPHQEVIELINQLIERKLTLVLVTGALRAEAELTLQMFGVRHLFAAIIAAEDVTSGKPNPEGYLKGAKAAGVDPGDCIVIEDAPSGVQAAKAAGMRCVAVTSGHSADELQGATLVIDWLRPGCLDGL